jgi:hypothetical protein
MNRPFYEAPEHVSEELKVAAYVCNVFSCSYEQYPPLHPLNGKLVQDGITKVVAEIKIRNNASTKYPTLMMSSDKWKRGLDWAFIENKPFMLFVKFTDGIFMTKVKNKYDEAIGGRTDRNDPNDVERCVYIPISSFKKI